MLLPNSCHQGKNPTSFPAEFELTGHRTFARDLFWKHLYPPWQAGEREDLSRVILSSQTRGMLIDIVFALVGEDSGQFKALLRDLESLVPFEKSDEEGASSPPI